VFLNDLIRKSGIGNAHKTKHENMILCVCCENWLC